MRELRALIPYLRPYHRIMAAGLAMVVISNALTPCVLVRPSTAFGAWPSFS